VIKLAKHHRTPARLATLRHYVLAGTCGAWRAKTGGKRPQMTADEQNGTRTTPDRRKLVKSTSRLLIDRTIVLT